jgi:hypothetical protein
MRNAGRLHDDRLFFGLNMRILRPKRVIYVISFQDFQGEHHEKFSNLAEDFGGV